MSALHLPLWILATFWGLVSGSALILGAAIAWFRNVPKKMIAVIMAFGSGVLISALAFDLMDEAFAEGGFDSTAIGFVFGAVLYSVSNKLLSKKPGVKHRKRSSKTYQKSEKESPGSGLAIAMGALIDGIPESIAIGVSMIHGGVVSIAAVVAIFLSNVPESISSTSGMKDAGRTRGYVFGIWGAITIFSGIASFSGYVLFRSFSPEIVAGTIAVAAGGILSMASSTMIPEAYEDAHDFVGVVTVLGFLCAFILNKI